MLDLFVSGFIVCFAVRLLTTSFLLEGLIDQVTCCVFRFVSILRPALCFHCVKALAITRLASSGSSLIVSPFLIIS